MPSDSSASRVDDAVTKLVALLHEYEHAQDRAVQLGGLVQSALIDARAEQNLSPTVIHAAFAKLAEGQLQLGLAKTATYDAHKVLEKISRVYGIGYRSDELAFGDEWKNPKTAVDETPRVAA